MSDRRLLLSRRFLPLFISQFVAAANDNFFKSAAVVLLTFRGDPGEGAILVTLATGLFMLPYFLFSALGGQLADRMDKSRLIRRLKIVEIPLMGLSGLALIGGGPAELLIVLFLLGVQSALFGPAKYAILPDHLPHDRLLAANGWIEAGTFVAILIGTMGGALLVLEGGGTLWVTAGAIGLAVISFLAALAIPPTNSRSVAVRLQPFAATRDLLRVAAADGTGFRLILAISWFWMLGAVYLAQIPPLTRDQLAGDQQVVTLFLALFTIGIAVGSIGCRTLLRGRLTTRYAAPALIVMALATVDFAFAVGVLDPIVAKDVALRGPAEIIGGPGGWRMVVDLLIIAAAAGVFVVPLYALLQRDAPDDGRARVIAANNVMNAAFMVGATIIATVLLAIGLTSAQLFLVCAVATLPAAYAVHVLSVKDTVPQPAPRASGPG